MSVFIPVPKKGNAEEICMQIKKKQLELDMEQWTGSKLGKESEKAVYCHPVTLYIVNVYAENIMQNARLEESQVGIQISRWNVNNFRYVDDTTVMAENEECRGPAPTGSRGTWRKNRVGGWFRER